MAVPIGSISFFPSADLLVIYHNTIPSSPQRSLMQANPMSREPDVFRCDGRMNECYVMMVVEKNILKMEEKSKV